MEKEIRALRSELALLKLQFSERVNEVEDKLNALLQQNAASAQTTSQPVSRDSGINQPASFTASIEYPSDSSNNSMLVNEGIQDSFVEQNFKTNTDKTFENKQPPRELTPQQPSFITVFFQTLLSSLFDWFSPVVKIYQSYKNRGMLGIFTLTIVGITLTLAGFGYLMQLLIDQLGSGVKSLLLAFAALSVIGLGIGLKIKTRYSEFATAIVALGILLSYSTVYFSGSVYQLLANYIVLFLYLLIAIVCHGLARYLDTKVIASLGIMGIATMPILSNTVQIEPLYYLLSLVFITTSSLIFSYRNTGNWLANLSLAFVIVALEWILGVESVAISVWIINLFYLLFFTYIVLALYRPSGENSSNSSLLTLLATCLGASILLVFQSSTLSSGEISANFAFNTLLAMAASIFFYKVKHQLTHIFILLTTLWAVLTVVSAVSEAYWGIAWAVEGLLLLFIGRKYLISSVVNQGQALTAIALVYSWSALALHFPLPALKSFDGWLLSIIIVAVIAIWQRVITDSKAFDRFSQVKIKAFLQLLEVIWLTILFVANTYIWLDHWAGISVILLQLAILFRARYCRQLAIEVVAAFLVIAPLAYVFHGAMLVNSYRFTELPTFAQLSLLSAFAQLWLWSAFYRKYYPNSAIKGIAEITRIIFYMLIPICWLGSAIRRFDTNVITLLWLSPLLALFFANKIKHHWLIIEAKLLTAIISLAFIWFIAPLTLVNSLVALLGFALFYGTAFYLFSKNINVKLHQFICSWGLISFGFTIAFVIGMQSDSLFSGTLAAALYWALAFNGINDSKHLQRNEGTITFVNLALIISAWAITSFQVTFAIIPCVFILTALYQKEDKYKHSWLGKKFGLNSELLLHAIAAVTYSTCFMALVANRLDLLIAPALAIHGALILFLKDKRMATVKFSFTLILLGIVKLAVIDAASALLWQKVVLFMGIGVFILAASFWYQKLVSNSNKVDIPIADTEEQALGTDQ